MSLKKLADDLKAMQVTLEIKRFGDTELPQWLPDGTEIKSVEQFAMVAGLSIEAAGILSSQEKRVVRTPSAWPGQPTIEDKSGKIRHVRDSEYWKLPVGAIIIAKPNPKKFPGLNVERLPGDITDGASTSSEFSATHRDYPGAEISFSVYDFGNGDIRTRDEETFQIRGKDGDADAMMDQTYEKLIARFTEEISPADADPRYLEPLPTVSGGGGDSPYNFRGRETSFDWGSRTPEIDEAENRLSMEEMSAVLKGHEDGSVDNGDYRDMIDRIKDEYDFTHGDISTIANDVSASAYGSSLSLNVNGEIRHRDRGYVGTFQRELRIDSDGSIHIHNAYLNIDSSAQGDHFAGSFNRHMENWYIANGVDDVNVNANIDVGGYAWARTGFDWDTNISYYEGETLLNRVDINDYVRTADPNAKDDLIRDIAEIRDRLDRFNPIDDEYPTPFEISNLGWVDGAETWPGKEALLGSNWNGIKYLRPDAKVTRVMREMKVSGKAKSAKDSKNRDLKSSLFPRSDGTFKRSSIAAMADGTIIKWNAENSGDSFTLTGDQWVNSDGTEYNLDDFVELINNEHRLMGVESVQVVKPPPPMLQGSVKNVDAYIKEDDDFDPKKLANMVPGTIIEMNYSDRLYRRWHRTNDNTWRTETTGSTLTDSDLAREMNMSDSFRMTTSLIMPMRDVAVGDLRTFNSFEVSSKKVAGLPVDTRMTYYDSDAGLMTAIRDADNDWSIYDRYGAEAKRWVEDHKIANLMDAYSHIEHFHISTPATVANTPRVDAFPNYRLMDSGGTYDVNKVAALPTGASITYNGDEHLTRVSENSWRYSTDGNSGSQLLFSHDEATAELINAYGDPTITVPGQPKASGNAPGGMEPRRNREIINERMMEVRRAFMQASELRRATEVDGPDGYPRNILRGTNGKEYVVWKNGNDWLGAEYLPGYDSKGNGDVWTTADLIDLVRFMDKDIAYENTLGGN